MKNFSARRLCRRAEKPKCFLTFHNNRFGHEFPRLRALVTSSVAKIINEYKIVVTYRSKNGLTFCFWVAIFNEFFLHSLHQQFQLGIGINHSCDS